MFCPAKLSMLHGFTNGVSVDVLYLHIIDILEYNLPYVQSGSNVFAAASTNNNSIVL